MRFWQFLKYEKSYIYVYWIGFLLLVTLFYVEPDRDWQWSTFVYALLLYLSLLIGFLLYRYWGNLHAISDIHEDESAALSLEAAKLRFKLEEMEKQYIRNLNAMQEKRQAYDDFIVSWFHEIKMPIAVLRLMQQTDIQTDSLREELNRIEHYVDQALYYAKLDSFNQDFDLNQVDLAKLAKQLVKDHARTFISKHIQVELQVSDIVVQSDVKWLQFILNQLITNSLKYTEDSGKIHIYTQDHANEKQLIIRDNGMGIDPKDLPRIFQRGFTGSNGRKQFKSTGMGLYLAQQLAYKLGHYLTCESEVDEYTEFIVHFPIDIDPYLETFKRTDR